MAKLYHCGISLTGQKLWKIFFGECLLSYKSGVCMSLSKDVNIEKKRGLSWLLLSIGVIFSVSHEQKSLQGLSKILGPISGMSYSHKRMKIYQFANTF